MQLKILAIDFNAQLLQRAKQACYPAVTVKNLPSAWKEKAFQIKDESYCLRPEYHAVVEFIQQDVRAGLPPGPLDILLCRNLVFTYYTAELQKRLLKEMAGILCKEGILLIGVHESLPAEMPEFQVVSERLGIYRYLGTRNNPDT
jgi:chemotaxis protein methyltransferase CheR